MTTPKPASAPPADALLPCPFCGNPNVTDDEGCFPLNHEHSRWEVRCGNPSCYAHEQQGATREEATAKWNRRAASAQVRAVEPSILSAGTLALLEKSRRTSDKINALLARDALGLIQSLIAWNRAQEYPPIRIGYEAGVAEFFSPSVAAKPAAEPVPVAQGDEPLDVWAARVAAQFDVMGESYDARQLRSIADHARREAELLAEVAELGDGIERLLADKSDLRSELTKAEASLAACRAVEEYEFEIWQDDAMQAGGTTSTLDAAVGEAVHYEMMYGQDGPVEVRYFAKRALTEQELDAAIDALRKEAP